MGSPYEAIRDAEEFMRDRGIKEEDYEGGSKLDEGKVRWELMPYDALHEVAKVLTNGALKYDAWNWKKGLDYGRLFGAAMRHLTKWWVGHDMDDEMPTNHLAHVAAGLLMLLSFQLSGPRKDDRPTFMKDAIPNGKQDEDDTTIEVSNTDIVKVLQEQAKNRFSMPWPVLYAEYNKGLIDKAAIGDLLALYDMLWSDGEEKTSE